MKPTIRLSEKIVLLSQSIIKVRVLLLTSKELQMKQTVHLLAILMAIFYCTPCVAAVDPLDVMEITPAEGTVTSLQSFTITFGDPVG